MAILGSATGFASPPPAAVERLPRGCPPVASPVALEFRDLRLALLVRQLAAGSRAVGATLAFYEGVEGRAALVLRRGEAGHDRDGRPARAAFSARFEALAEEVTGPGATGEPRRRYLEARLCRGEIVIDDSVDPGSALEEVLLLHELGHAESAARDPLRYLELGSDERETNATCEPLAPSERPLEQEADAFLRRAFEELGIDPVRDLRFYPTGAGGGRR